MTTVYLGLLALLLGFENKLVYHPLTAAAYWSPPQGIQREELTLKSSTGDDIHAWWCPDSKAHFTILFSHGNAGNLSGHAWVIPEMRSRFPCNVLIYDYPGFGKSTGSPSETGCYAAACTAYSWLRDQKHIPPEKLILMGQSLGCAMACELAKKKDHRALVLLSPFTSIRDVGQEMMPLFPVRWLMQHHYDNRTKLEHYKQPLLVAHSTADEVIPFHHGKELYEAAGTRDKKFIIIQGQGHNDFSIPFFEAMKTFLEKLKE